MKWNGEDLGNLNFPHFFCPPSNIFFRIVVFNRMWKSCLLKKKWFISNILFGSVTLRCQKFPPQNPKQTKYGEDKANKIKRAEKGTERRLSLTMREEGSCFFLAQTYSKASSFQALASVEVKGKKSVTLISTTRLWANANIIKCPFFSCREGPWLLFGAFWALAQRAFDCWAATSVVLLCVQSGRRNLKARHVPNFCHTTLLT